MDNELKNYRIGYTVGSVEEHETRYFDERFTKEEAERQVAEMRSIDAKPGLRGAKIDSNYFCEPDPALTPVSDKPQQPEIVTLKNGSQEGRAAVQVLMMVLRDLFSKQPIVAYELVMVARDRNHEIWGTNTKQELIDRKLLQLDGSMHDTTRNIILSAVGGEKFDMVLVNPIEEVVNPS